MKNAIPLRERLLMVWNWLGLLRNPLDTERVFNMANIGLRNRHRQKELFQGMEEDLLRIPEFASLYEERYLPDLERFNSLAELPAQTFGRQYYDFMQQNQLDPNFFTSVPIEDVFTYVSELMRRTHDMWHTILGRGPSIDDEVYIQAFMMGQNGDPLAASIVAAGLLHRIGNDPYGLKQLMNHVQAGYQLGKQAQPLVGVRWDQHFQEDIESLRQRLGIQVYSP